MRVALEGGPGVGRELAARATLGRSVAQYVLRNMVRAGEAVICREDRVPGVKRPVPVYALAADPVREYSMAA